MREHQYTLAEAGLGLLMFFAIVAIIPTALRVYAWGEEHPVLAVLGGQHAVDVLGRDRLDMVGRRVAASTRHVGDDDGWIAWDMLRHVTGDQARIGVVSSTCAGSDDDPDLLTLVELSNRTLRISLRSLLSVAARFT